MSIWKKLFGAKEDLVMQDDPEQEEVICVPVIECDCKARQQEYLFETDKLVKEVNRLKKEAATLTTVNDKAISAAHKDLEKVRLAKKMEIEDIQHMQKILDEQNKLRVDRASFEAEKTAENEIKKIRKEYAEKLEKELIGERKKMQDVMNNVMAALPNVNVRLKGGV